MRRNIKETDTSSSGSFEGKVDSKILKSKINKIHNTKELEISEVTDASSSGGFDVPFGGGRKGKRNPLKIDGVKSIYKNRAVKDKNFPRFGGPDGKYVKINDRCKKFPYCNQGDKDILQLMEDDKFKKVINELSKEKSLPKKLIEETLIKHFNSIFI